MTFIILLIIVPLTLVLVGLFSWAAIRMGLGFFRAVATIVGRILEFLGGVIGDVARIIGASIACVVLCLPCLLNVIVGRWSAANHFAEAVRREFVILVGHLWSVVVRRPLRVLFLDSMLEGLEVRAVDAVRGSPGADRPRGGVVFPGFEVVGSLPSGGSGAKLYIARPDDRTRERLEGRPQEVVVKSFALAEGSSLPQIVRESRSLESARALGLVLAHEMDETTFWYAMPYHPGDHLGIAVREAHAADFEDGLRGANLVGMLGYAIDLVSTLDRYHRRGLWHKDVKPDNIIIHDGAAHLVDFGLVTSLRSAMTLTTHGTEYFRDPEMVRMAMRGVRVHEVNGAKFDVYGAGAVLYFMLENTFPGHGGLSRFERPAPEALRWVVRRAMADYGQRYETTALMLADLRVVSEAVDPWSVTPAMLPSMRGGEGIEEPMVDDDWELGEASPRTSPPPPPPPPPPVARINRRGVPRAEAAGVKAVIDPPGRPSMRPVADEGDQAGNRPGSGKSSPYPIISSALVATTVSFIIAFFIALLVIFRHELILDGERSLGDGGPLALVEGWEERLAITELPSSSASPRLVMIESPLELLGTNADEAIRGLRSMLETRGWEIVQDPEILAESIIGMPREGIASLASEPFAVALQSLEELAEEHGVENVLYVRTVGDDVGGFMELEFWCGGVGSFFSVPLQPDRFRIDGGGSAVIDALGSWVAMVHREVTVESVIPATEGRMMKMDLALPSGSPALNN